MVQERRILLVTGASRVIGRVTALTGAEQHMELVLVARRDADGLQATAEQARARGVRATTVLADLSLPTEIEQIAGNLEREHGRLDTRMSNAGIASRRGLMELSLAEW